MFVTRVVDDSSCQRIKIDNGQRNCTVVRYTIQHQICPLKTELKILQLTIAGVVDCSKS